MKHHGATGSSACAKSIKQGQRSYSGYVCSGVSIGFGVELLQVQINTVATGAGEMNGWSEEGRAFFP